MIDIRRTGVSDIPLVALHRERMFRDMGLLTEDRAGALVDATRAFLEDAIPRGEYIGWLATPHGEPARAVGGAGAQLRRILPFPVMTSGEPAVASGRQAIVINVYTEPDWRRRGVARALMHAVLDWARDERLDSLVLHASDDGRALYEELGFVSANEMQFAKSLRTDRT